jgi:hypothetical protein
VQSGFSNLSIAMLHIERKLDLDFLGYGLDGVHAQRG